MEILQIIITGVFSLLVALGSVWLKHYLDTKKKAVDDADYESISDSDIDNMMDIQKYIEDFRTKWDFDRIGIYQFHNGGKFFHGVPMKKYSQSYESTGPGVSKIKDKNQNVLVTEHPFLMKSMSESGFFSIDASDPALDYTREKINEFGILQIVTCSIRALSGQLIGFVQIQTVKHKIDITEELEKSVEELVSNISGYILRKK